MFVQVIQGKVSDKERARERMESWIWSSVPAPSGGSAPRAA